MRLQQLMNQKDIQIEQLQAENARLRTENERLKSYVYVDSCIRCDGCGLIWWQGNVFVVSQQISLCHECCQNKEAGPVQRGADRPGS